MSRHGKPRGHFCWVCGRNRPNERFSGRGHRRHVCKDCSQLGEDELVFLQAVRDIDQTLDWDGLIRRKRRKSFQRFLSDTNPRIRAYALEVQARDRRVREEIQDANAQDALELEALVGILGEKSREGLAPSFEQLALAEGFAEWSEDDALAEIMVARDPERDSARERIGRENECEIPF